MAIIKSKDVVEVGRITKDLKKVRKGIDALTKSNDALATSLQNVKKSNDGKEARALVKTTNDLNKSTKDLTDTQKEAEKLQKQLKSLTDEEVKAKLKFNEANKKQREELKALITIEDKQAGTLEKLRARNKQLAIERNKLNLETQKGRQRLKEINAELDKNNKKLKKNADALSKQKINIGNYVGGLVKMGVQLLKTGILMVGLRGAINGVKDIIGATAEGQIFLAKVTGATNTILATFRDKIIDGWNALTDFNSGVEDTRTLIEKLSDGFFDFYSVRGEGFLKFIDAGSLILKGDFKKALTSLTDGFVQLATGIEGATEKTKAQLAEIERMAVFGAQIAKSEKQLELDRSRFAIQEAKDIRTIADLRAKAADKANFTAAEREKFLTRALALTQKLGDKNEEFANREKELAQATFNANKSNQDDEIALNLLKQKADDVAAASLKKQKLLIAELQTVKNQAAQENITIIDEKLLKEIEANDKEIEAQQKLDDELLEMEEDFQEEKFEIGDKAAEDDEKRTQESEDAKLAIREKALRSGIQLASDIFSSFQDERLAELQTDSEAEKAILKQRLDDGVISEEQFKSQIAEIDQKFRRESAIADKKKAIFDIAIATAVAIAKAGFITPAAIAIGIIGAIQIAAVAAKPIPTLAKGEVNINAPSHARGGKLVEIEGGESYVNKHATAQSEDVLNMVNDGILTDKNFSQMTKEDNNIFLAGLLMKGNQNSSDMIELLSRLGVVYKRGNENYIERATGKIERFI